MPSSIFFAAPDVCDIYKNISMRYSNGQLYRLQNKSVYHKEYPLRRIVTGLVILRANSWIFTTDQCTENRLDGKCTCYITVGRICKGPKVPPFASTLNNRQYDIWSIWESVLEKDTFHKLFQCGKWDIYGRQIFFKALFLMIFAVETSKIFS